MYNITEDCIDRPSKEPNTKNKPALIFAGDTYGSEDIVWNYAHLAEKVNVAANAFRANSFRKGDRVLLKLANGPEFPQLFFGAIRAGVLPIPASPLLTVSETAFLKKDSGAKRIFSSPSQVAAFLKKHPKNFRRPVVRPPATRLKDPAYWLYTSGTEGRPKAVIHSHGSIPAHDARSREWLGLRPEDVVLNTSALSWSYALTAGLADILRAGVTSVILCGRPDPRMILETVLRREVTVLMSVPGWYRILTEFLESHPRFLPALRRIRVAVSAGEKLSEDVRRRFHRATGLWIREGLGMTEHSIYLGQVLGRKIVPGSCGRAFSGHRISILKEDGSEAKPGEIGVLASHRSCPGLLVRYRGRSPKKSFSGPWFLSGDLAYRDERGNFFYVGRHDDVITAGGYRISPMEVEAVLNRHKAVSESAVIGEAISPGRTAVTACIVPRGDGPVDVEVLEAFCRKFLAKYKVPRRFVVTSALPKTSNGKIKRQDLKLKLQVGPR